MAGKKLLVADDSLTIQKVIRLALSNEGYEIQAVSDGNDAIQQISLFRPDVVLIDVSLPGKSAFEVKKAINDQGDLEEVRFILMSSAFEKVDEPLAAEVKFHGRLTKPFDPAHLRQVLTDVLAQVLAKRMESTSLLSRPAPEAPAPAPVLPPPTPARAAPTLPPPLPPIPDKPSFMPPPLPPVSSEKIMLTPPDDADAEVGGHEDLLDPIRPDAAPVFETEAPGGPAGKNPVETLWDKEGDATDPSFTPPPLPGARPAESMDPFLNLAPPPLPQEPESAPESGAPGESDIKHLTESTIRMSGLDDFQWSINENARKPAAPAAPAPPAPSRPAASSGAAAPPMSVGEKTLTALHAREPAIRPPAVIGDLGGATFRIDPPASEAADMPPFYPDHAEAVDPEASGASAYQNAPEEPSIDLGMHADDSRFQSPPPPPLGGFGTTDDFSLTTPMSPQSSPDQPQVMPITTGQMEELLQRQLQETLERMARQILPEVAERILKQEIHRLLQEQP